MQPIDRGAEVKRRERRGMWLAIVGLVVLVGGMYVAGHFLLGNRLPTGTRIAGVGVGGLTPEQAKERLEADLGPHTEQTLTFFFEQDDFEIKPDELGLSLNIEESVESAGGGRTWNPVRMLENIVGADRLDPVVTFDTKALGERIDTIANRIDVAPVEPRITFENGQMKTRRPAPGREVKREEFEELIRDQFVQDHSPEPVPVDTDWPGVRAGEFDKTVANRVKTAVGSPLRVAIANKKYTLSGAEVKSMLTYVSHDGRMTARIDMDRFRRLVTAKATTLTRDPTDATVVLRGGKPKVVADKPGRGIKTDGAQPKVIAALEQKPAAKRVVQLSLTTRHAGFRTPDAKRLGIKRRVGTYNTRFRVRGAIKPGHLAGRIDGAVLRPGEVLAFNAKTGSPGRSNANRDGASQVATTLLNAGLKSGLKVVERHRHRYYQSRFPAGRDSAVGPANRDLRLKNTSKYGVLVHAWTEFGRRSGIVHVELWSSKQWKVSVSSGKRHNKRKPPVRTVRRKRCTPRSGQQGFDIDVHQKLVRDGKTVRGATLSSSYDPKPRIRCRRPRR